MKEMNIIKRSLKNGFNLSSIPNYNPKGFRDGLYDYLLSKHYSVSEEEGILYVGYNLFEDTAKVIIKDATMRIKPLKEEGFYEILIELFKYVGTYSVEQYQPQEDMTTESYSEDDSSEEMWL